MKKVELRVFSGRNVYLHRPAALLLLDLAALKGIESRAINGFNERLLDLLPGLRQHGCSGNAAGFAGRLREGTYFGHVLEHVLLELQICLGLNVRYGKTRADTRPGIYHIVFECSSPALAPLLTEQGLELMEALLWNREYDLSKTLAELSDHLAAERLGPSCQALKDAARLRGISVRELGFGSLLQLGTGCHARRIQATLTDRTPCLAVDIAGDKAASKELMRAAGLPVPSGCTVSSPGEALDFWYELQRPIAIKPVNGNQGRGVSLNLQSEEQVLVGYAQALKAGEGVLVEETVPGRHFRLLTVDGALVAASERIPAHVVGDGIRSVAGLVAETNSAPERGRGHEKPLTRIAIDGIVMSVLLRQNHSLDSIPLPGEVVWLRDSANLSTGGTAHDITEAVHPEWASLAVRAARVVGLDVAGVDVVAADISSPPSSQKAAIIEINAAPGIRMHHFPSVGVSQDAASHIVDSLFPPGAPSEIPIIAVTGTNGKTTVSRLLAHVLRPCYATVGLTSTAGIYHNDHLLVPGDTTGPWSSEVLLRDSATDIAVLELARGGLLHGGLAYDLADVALLTNITDDHIGQDNVRDLQDLAWVKSLVLEAVKPGGSVIMNADDPVSVSLLREQQREVILFSTQPDNPKVSRHLGAGGRAVFVRHGLLVLAEGSGTRPLLPVKRIPLTFRAMAKYNVANAAAAAAALWGFGIAPAVIRRGLGSFMPDEKHNPGRQNFRMVGERRLLIDFAHNAAGISSMAAFARQLSKGRLLVIAAAPSNRSTANILEVGKALGRGFDELFIKEDLEPKGRLPGEVAAIIKRGALSVGMAESAVRLCLKERTGLWGAYAASRPDDLIVLFYEDLAYTNSLLDELENAAPELSQYSLVGGIS